MSQCPVGWSDSDGFDDDEILLASHGGFGGSGHANGMRDYFDGVNAAGGVLGRRVRFEHIDIAPGDSVQYLQGLTWALDQEPLAVSAVGGTAVSPEMAERVDDACIPNLFWESLIVVANPEAREWTVPGFQSIEAEVAIWLTWIVETFGPDAAIVAVVMDNIWGALWLEAIEAERNATAPSTSLTVVKHDPAAPDLTDELDSASYSRADVFLGATAGNLCLRLLIDRAGIPELADTAVLLPSVCSLAAAHTIPAGEAANDVLFVDVIGARDETDETRHLSYWHGWLAGFLIVEALEVADTLPGGLGRSNLLRAATSIERDHPLIDGAIIGAGRPRFGALKRWSIAEKMWLNHSDTPFAVDAVEPADREDPDCDGPPHRLQVTASGWSLRNDRLDPASVPSVTVDGLGTAIQPPVVGASPGLVTITSGDGVEQFGRLFRVPDPCGRRLVVEPLPWFVDDVSTRPGPYEIKLELWLLSEQITASARLTTDAEPLVFTLDQLSSPLN